MRCSGPLTGAPSPHTPINFKAQRHYRSRTLRCSVESQRFRQDAREPDHDSICQELDAFPCTVLPGASVFLVAKSSLDRQFEEKRDFKRMCSEVADQYWRSLQACGVCLKTQNAKSVTGGSTPSRLNFDAIWPR